MGTLNLKGRLNLVGRLSLKDKVTVANVEALVQVPPSGPYHATAAAPVILPPPPAAPLDPAPTVCIINSFNQTVTANGKPIVTQGMAMQGSTPTWPGMVMPSQGNPLVTIGHLPINVVGDQATIFPSGAPAALTSSGQ